MIRFQFVEDHRNTHEVKRMCQVMGSQRSSFYKWRQGREARQARKEYPAWEVCPARPRSCHA